MDPDATLEELLGLARGIIKRRDKALDAESAEELACAGDELAQHVLNLDEWIERGGFMPARWARGPRS